MPYQTIAELPAQVKALPKRAQEIFRAAFNSAYGGDEQQAFRIAWAAVKRKYRKEGDKWVPKKEAVRKALTEAAAFYKKHGIELPEALKEALSFGDIRDRILLLIDPPDSEGKRTYRYWISMDEIYSDYCIVHDETSDKDFLVNYAIDADSNITIGQWQEVEMVWQVKPGGATLPAPVTSDLSEGMEEGEIESLTHLSEAQALGGNKFRMTVLRVGWNVRLDGSPGDKYYTRESIATLVPLVEGTKAFADHPTEREERERPQRSVKELVGYWTDAKQELDGRVTATLVLLESAAWLKPALVAAEQLNSKGIVFIGPSINGFGNARIGDAEGRRGKIVESIKTLPTLYVVNAPRAGGTVDKLLEGAKGDDTVDWTKITLEELKKNRPDLVQAAGQEKLAEARSEIQKDLDDLKTGFEKQIASLKESAEAENKRLRDELQAERLKSAIKAKIAEQLRESKLPDVSQKRLSTLLEARDFTRDGAIDETALKEAVTAAVNEERNYLSKLTEAGKVTGMGGGGEQPKPEERVKTVQDKLDKMFGLPEPKKE